MAHVPFATFHMSYEGTLVTVYFPTHHAYILLTNLANCVVCCTFVASLSMLEFVFSTGKRPITMDTNSLRILFGVVIASHVC